MIDVKKLQENCSRQLSEDLISPATEQTVRMIAVDHSAEPIKKVEDIMKIKQYLIDNGRYRDNMLFIVGINFGLRASDLRMLRFSDLINDNLTFKETFPVFEKKTRNTRKRKKNRYITINNAVIEAATLYLENTPNVTLSDFLFKSESRNSADKNEPLTVRSMDRLLKGIANDVGLSMRVSTHTLRKTFCYHQMLISHNDTRKLLLLQKMLNHSSPVQTLEYIGITAEEIEDAYRNLNLGSAPVNEAIDSLIEESDYVEPQQYKINIPALYQDSDNNTERAVLN